MERKNQLPEFEYLAIDNRGRTKTGRLTGDSAKSIRQKLLVEGLRVLKVKSPSGSRVAKENLPKVPVALFREVKKKIGQAKNQFQGRKNWHRVSQAPS